jgi:lipopolysaccharide export system protein LptA
MYAPAPVFLTILYRVAALVGVLIISIPVFSQEATSTRGGTKRIEVLGAEKFEFRTEADSRKRILSGNVRLRHEDALMWCNTAILFMEYNFVEAEGKVHIQKGDSIDIYGDKLLYYGDNKSGLLTGNVRLYDRTMELLTPQLEYDLDRDIGNFSQGGKLISDSTTLTSKSGTYFHKNKMAHFKGDVVLANPRFTMYADSMRYNTDTKVAYFTGPTRVVEKDGSIIYCESGFYDTKNDIAKFGENTRMSKDNSILEARSIDYNQKTKSGYATGNVYWQDTVETVEIFSDHAIYKEDSSYIKSFGDPLLVDADGSDTLYLSADTLISYAFPRPLDTIPAIERTETDSLSTEFVIIDSLLIPEISDSIVVDTPATASDSIRVFMAYNNVKLLRKNMSALCDSLFYSSMDSTYKLYGSPVLWVDSTQFTSDSVYLRMSDKKINQVTLYQNALIIHWSDTNGVFNQTAGRQVDGFFENDSLRRMEVTGNGESIYFIKDDSSRYIGANRTECGRITAFFEQNELQRILFETEPEAKFTPIRQVNFESFKLNGFAWHWDKKPMNKYDIIRNNNPFQTFHLSKMETDTISDESTMPVNEEALPKIHEDKDTD